jgi:hypothetical protein
MNHTSFQLLPASVLCTVSIQFISSMCASLFSLFLCKCTSTVYTEVYRQRFCFVQFCPEFWAVATCSTKYSHEFWPPFLPATVSVCFQPAQPPLLRRRRRLSDFGADSSSTSTTVPGPPTPRRQGLLPGVRRIGYFRFDTEATTWIR